MKLILSKTRKGILTISALCLVVLFIIYNFDIKVGEKSCGGYDETCVYIFNEVLFDGLYQGLFLKLVVLSSLILLFFSEHVYRVWKWFALFAIPLGILRIIFPINEPYGGLLGGKEVGSDMLGYGFLFVTILIALFVTIKDWFKKRKA